MEEKVKVIEDREKGIKLKLEEEEKGKIIFMDVEIERGNKNERIRTRCFRKRKMQEYTVIGGVMWARLRKII